MQRPGLAGVRGRPSLHLSLPRPPAPLSLLSGPGAARCPPVLPGHPRRPRTCQPSPESPNPAGGSAHLPASLVPSPAEAPALAVLALHLTGLSAARRRPAQHQRPLRAGPHAHHPGLGSLTHVSPRPLKEPHCRARPEAARRGPGTFKRRDLAPKPFPWTRPPPLLLATRTSPSPPAAQPVYAMTQARRATSSGSTRESRDPAAAWRGSRGVGRVASLPPACLTPRVRRPGELVGEGRKLGAGCARCRWLWRVTLLGREAEPRWMPQAQCKPGWPPGIESLGTAPFANLLAAGALWERLASGAWRRGPGFHPSLRAPGAVAQECPCCSSEGWRRGCTIFCL